MESQVDSHKTLFIKAEIAKLRKANPRLTFREAWNQVQRERPDWMASADEPVKRSWHEQLPPSRDQLKDKINAGTPFLDLVQICKEMRIPVRVEASRDGGPDYLSLEDGHYERLREWVELQGYELMEK